MLIIDTGNTDPCFNLAAEEYFFRNYDRDIFMIYINERSVIIGKHQNPWEEVNIKYLRENDIPLIRRISGGGTVYHDMGNLNYTYIRNTPDGKQVNFKEYTKPLISFLDKYGVNAYRGEKNEIRSGGLKISGNAEHVFKNRVLHHGTVLFDADLRSMSACLIRSKAEIKSRAVKSNRTVVCNIKGKVQQADNIEELKSRFIDYVMNSEKNTEIHRISDKNIASIDKLVRDKFSTWEWNYAYGPDFSYRKSFRKGNDTVNIQMHISQAVIKSCSINGSGELKILEQSLPGTKFCFDDIEKLMDEMGLPSDKDSVYNFLS